MLAKITLGLAIAALFFTIALPHNTKADSDTVRCEDIGGKTKYPITPSKHNEPSEKKFLHLVFVEDALPCEVAKCYELNQCEGTIKQGKWDEFKKTAAYMGTTEDVQKCFEHRYNLPDDGKKALQAYEFSKCQTGAY